MSRMITYCQAINEATLQAMEDDNRVIIYGIGVPDHKRVFGSTKNLVEKFGPHRCFDTPIAEDSMTGIALGAAITGLRPIHVHMRMDFLLLAMNQIVNLISSYRYGSAGAISVPIVIRVVVGRGWGQSYQHSKTIHSIFGHIPGLKVVMPSTPYEAKGMLLAAIRDDNPVIFIEHRWMYDILGKVPEDRYEISIDSPRLLRKGKDLTIIATSWMNIEAMFAAELLLKYHSLSIEVINACVASDFNDAMIVESIKKTNKCIIADNDWIHCGFSAELSARIAEKCFLDLVAPVRRIGFKHVPCPCTRSLENLYYSNAYDIVRETENLFGLKPANLSQEKFFSYENKFMGPF